MENNDLKNITINLTVHFKDFKCRLTPLAKVSNETRFSLNIIPDETINLPDTLFKEDMDFEGFIREAILRIINTKLNDKKRKRE